MRIKFKSPDPRAGMIAQMDSIRGRQLIELGAAEEVKDDGGRLPAPARGTAPDPTEAAGTPSSASPAAPASRRTTAKQSAGGAKKGRGAA